MERFACEDIKNLRLSCNLSVDEVSQKTGISTEVIEQLEAGNRSIKLVTVMALLEIYDADIDFSRRTST